MLGTQGDSRGRKEFLGLRLRERKLPGPDLAELAVQSQTVKLEVGVAARRDDHPKLIRSDAEQTGEWREDVPVANQLEVVEHEQERLVVLQRREERRDERGLGRAGERR